MGKSPKPLRILVTDSTMLGWDELVRLQQQGHTVVGLDWLRGLEDFDPQFDIVIGPHCWRMDDNLRPFLDLAIKEARARAYPSK